MLMELSQRQIPQDLTHVTFKKQTLRCSELVVARGEVGGEMGEIHKGDQDHTYIDERREMYRIVESVCCAPETNITMYVNYS